MKTKKFLSALVAMMCLVNTSSWGQSKYAGERTETTPGNVDLSSWIVPVGQSVQIYVLKIVAEYVVDPQVVKTGVYGWNSPNRSFPLGYPSGYENAQWAPSFLSGYYTIDGGSKGKVNYDVHYITDPWIGVDQTATTASPHLSSLGGTVTAQNFVSLKINSIFATGKFTNWCIKIVNGKAQTVDKGKDQYQVSESGDYAIMVSYTGTDFSYSAFTYFSINIIGTPTPTVSNVTVSPSSTSVDKGAGRQFTATVQGTNNPGQSVSWTVEGKTSAMTTINATGDLSVGNDENATQLVVRATSAVDPTKSGTATVNVVSPQPTQYTVSTSSNPSNGGTTSGGGTFNAGTTQTVVGIPANGWQFICWRNENGSIVSTNVSYSFTLNGNRNLTAYFEVIPPTKFRVCFTVNLPDAIIALGERTQAAGQYIFDDVAPGTHTYTVSRTGYQSVYGIVQVVDQQVILEITLVENPPENKPKSPIFEGLVGEYQVGAAPVALKVVGEGTEGMNFTYTVNGNPVTIFTPNVKGTFYIEAVAGDGSTIWRTVIVN